MSESKLKHYFFENGDLILALEGVEWYDTSSPYKYCAVCLWRIGKKIRDGIQIKIISYGNEYEPTSVEDFKKWITNTFNNEYNGGFEKYIDLETQPFT